MRPFNAPSAIHVPSLAASPTTVAPKPAVTPNIDDILDCFEVKKHQGGLDFSNVMDKIDAVANKVHEIKALIK